MLAYVDRWAVEAAAALRWRLRPSNWVERNAEATLEVLTDLVALRQPDDPTFREWLKGRLAKAVEGADRLSPMSPAERDTEGERLRGEIADLALELQRRQLERSRKEAERREVELEAALSGDGEG